MKMLKQMLFILVLCLAVTGCGKKTEEEFSSAESQKLLLPHLKKRPKRSLK